MQFSKFLMGSTAFAVAQALVAFTDPAGSFSEITAGKNFNFTWSGATGPVTLTLANGGANNLQPVSVIQSGLTDNSYVWSVPSTLTADTYAVEITDGSTTNYSPQFQLIGGVTSSSSAASSTSSGSSTGSTASTASTTSSGSSTTSTGSSASKNSTTTSASKTSSTGSSSTKTTSSTGAASSTSAPSSASGLASPLAFVFLALAAFFTLN